MQPLPISPDRLERSPDVELEFLRSSGPGGQNVNKVSTAVRLRFAVLGSQLLPEDVRGRLVALAGNRMTDTGDLVIEARRFRTQERNRADALHRLAALIAKAWQAPKPRRPTKPTIGARERRLRSKRQRAAVKQTRGKIAKEDE